MTGPMVSWAVGSDGERILDAEDARAAIGALWTPSGPATARAGLRPTADGTQGRVTATSPTPDTKVHVAPFQYVLPSSRGAATPYILTLASILDIDPLGDHPADPANPRHDLIVAQQSDAAFGDTDSQLRIRQVVGDPSGAPADPDPTAGGTLSPDYLLMARVRVDAGATEIDNDHIDNLLPPDMAVALGGILPVTDQAERDAVVGAYAGLGVFRLDTGFVEVFDGAAWAVHSATSRATLLRALLGDAGIHREQAAGNTQLTEAAPYAGMTVGGAVVGHTFIAPPSGIVLLEWGASVSTSIASGSTIFMGTEVAQGDVVGIGAIQSEVVDEEATEDNGLENRASSKCRTVTGLAPGSTYNVYVSWRQSGNATATAQNPYVYSIPQLA